jgi:hypothetical protein
MNAPAAHLQPVESFEAARTVAERIAEQEVGRFTRGELATFLSSTSLSENGCWFFFANETISIPRASENSLVFTAYAISPNGRHGLVYDFRPDTQKMTEYARVWSLHSIGARERLYAVPCGT